MKNALHSPLGQSFADHNGGKYATVFLGRVQDEAAAASVPWVAVLAYATAHEVGHLLLGQAHTPRGLMKAQWDRDDYQAINQNHLHFSEEQMRELTGRYGTTSQPEVVAPTVEARRSCEKSASLYFTCVSQMSLWTSGRLITILSRATLR